MVDAVIGLVAKTGSAVAVTLTDVFDHPVLADRRTLDLSRPQFSRFVFHEAQSLDAVAARRFVQRCSTAVARCARTQVDTLMRDLRHGGVRVARGAIVTSDKPFAAPALDRILGSHSLVHAAEGELYRSVLIDAFDRHDIDVEPIARGELGGRAARALGSFGGNDAFVSALGRVAGSPWRREHKDAALAAVASAASTV